MDSVAHEHPQAELFEPVTDRYQSARQEDLPQEGSAAALTLARNRRRRNLPWYVCILLGVANIVQPVLYMTAFSQRRQVVLMDANSNLLVSPLLEPLQSNQIQEICFTWAAKGLMDRTPVGFANYTLLKSYFTEGARQKADADWLAQEQQAKIKQIFQEFSVYKMSVQAREGNRLIVRVDGQLRAQATVNGILLTEPRPEALEFTFITNPDMGNNRLFPLVVEGWRHLEDPLPLPGT